MHEVFTPSKVKNLLGEKHENFEEKGIEFLAKRLNGGNSKRLLPLLHYYINNQFNKILQPEFLKSVSIPFGTSKLTPEELLIISLGRVPRLTNKKKWAERDRSVVLPPNEPEYENMSSALEKEEARRRFEKQMKRHKACLAIYHKMGEHLDLKMAGKLS